MHIGRLPVVRKQSRPNTRFFIFHHSRDEHGFWPFVLRGFHYVGFAIFGNDRAWVYVDHLGGNGHRDKADN